MQDLRQSRHPSTTIAIAGVLLIGFLALPWLLMLCRELGMPTWIYGAEPMLGWLRVWALAPVWLLLGAIVALVLAARKAGTSS